MALISFVLGKECKLFYKVDGQEGGGAWLSVPYVRELAGKSTKEEVDLDSRASGQFKVVGADKIAESIEFDMLYNPNDPAFQAFLARFYDTAPGLIGIQCFDPDDRGLEGDWDIFDFSRGQPLNGAATVSVILKPAPSTIPLHWVEP